MTEVTQEVETYTDQDLLDILPIYYKRLFPHGPFYRWLSYKFTENSIFRNREFSFTLMDDVYIRYQSFEDEAEWKTELCAKNPFKIDIGAVMSVRPKDHRALNGFPIQRELVFDIDMTDYDDVRTCCSGAEICQKCWKYMTVACRVLDVALREDFGFEHILWVFSGRRGIHCWVCDKIARHMNNRNRGSVAEYLNILQVQNGVARVFTNERMHHSIKRAHRIVEPFFDEIVVQDQNLFGTAAGRKKLTELIPEEKIRLDLEERINAIEEGESKVVWDTVKRYFAANRGARRMMNIIEEIQLALLYPRLDINVSKGMNHLLKSPFCVHPKTGKICVPFNPSAAAKFDPTTVPTIRQVLNEVNSFDIKNTDEEKTETKSKIQCYKKTAMYKGVTVFEEFVRKLETSLSNRDKLAVSDAKMEF